MKIPEEVPPVHYDAGGEPPCGAGSEADSTIIAEDVTCWRCNGWLLADRGW